MWLNHIPYLVIFQDASNNLLLFSFRVVPFWLFFLGLVEGDILLPLNLDK